MAQIAIYQAMISYIIYSLVRCNLARRLCLISCRIKRQLNSLCLCTVSLPRIATSKSWSSGSLRRSRPSITRMVIRVISLGQSYPPTRKLRSFPSRSEGRLVRSNRQMPMFYFRQLSWIGLTSKKPTSIRRCSSNCHQLIISPALYRRRILPPLPNSIIEAEISANRASTTKISVVSKGRNSIWMGTFCPTLVTTSLQSHGASKLYQHRQSTRASWINLVSMCNSSRMKCLRLHKGSMLVNNSPATTTSSK